MATAMASDAHRSHTRRAESILTAGSVYVGTESIYYAASGVSEAGSAILFLHEAGGSGATWNGQLVGMAQKARCLVPDLPGHGQSGGHGFQTIAEYRKAMIGFLDALAIRWPVVIAGVCLGAAIAVDLAFHAPDRVAGLVLAGIQEGGRLDPDSFRQVALSESPSFVNGLFGESASERLRSEQLRRWRSTCPTVRYGDLIALSVYPIREALRYLNDRVLMVAGDQDSCMPPDEVACLAMAAPRGEAVVVESAGCLAMLEQPERFNQVVGDFLEEVHPAVPVVPARAYGGGYRRFRSPSH